MMATFKSFATVISIATIIISMAACTPAPVPVPAPETVTPQPSQEFGILDISALAYAKAQIERGDILYLKPFDRLKSEAAMALVLTPPSVLDKPFMPPSGNKHDYMSMGPYWWPNPDTPDSLPYIRKDGVVNPERNAYDKIPGATMSEAVRVLSLMYYLTDDTQYAVKATELLRVWFLNEETRMNPNLEFGQFIPGRGHGRSVGIIESRNFVFLTDYELLLRSFPGWTSADQEKLKAWMQAFMHWLVNSDLGQQEGERTNNHGSWYDFQVLALSHYCLDAEMGNQILEGIHQRRFAAQIDEAGKQAEELARTKSFNYSVFNLDALSKIITLSEKSLFTGIERSKILDKFRQGVDYLVPYTVGSSNWPYTQISGISGAQEKMIGLINCIAAHDGGQDYRGALQVLTQKYPTSRLNITTNALQASFDSAGQVD